MIGDVRAGANLKKKKCKDRLNFPVHFIYLRDVCRPFYFNGVFAQEFSAWIQKEMEDASCRIKNNVTFFAFTW